MLSVKVEPLINERGRDVSNHFVINTDEGTYYQGLRTERSIIAFKDKLGNVTLDKNYWDYPDPIEKNRERFLGEDEEVTAKKVEKGEYQLADLNRIGEEDRRKSAQDEGDHRRL